MTIEDAWKRYEKWKKQYEENKESIDIDHPWVTDQIDLWIIKYLLKPYEKMLKEKEENDQISK